MRMLTPCELFAAQSFPADYIIDPIGPSGKPLTKTAQIRMCGNSVCPPLAAALVRANYAAMSSCAEPADTMEVFNPHTDDGAEDLYEAWQASADSAD